jgi:aryl-alcohol dehydrogenase-like predicted oxidoreductase
VLEYSFAEISLGKTMTNANSVPVVTLGDELSVSAIGFGAMALTPVYGEVDDTESLATLNRRVDLGVTFIDTANVYGGGENEKLIARLLADRRDEVTRATKFGIAGDAAYVRQCIDENRRRRSLLHAPPRPQRTHRGDRGRHGRVRHPGLSEVTADELRAAVAVHPIAAVQSEWSIWSRDVERNVVPAAAELGVGFVVDGLSAAACRGSARAPLTPTSPWWRW